MPDNTRGGSNDGSLPLIATDDVGGVQYQRVKLDVGADGASTPVVGTVPVSGTVDLVEGAVLQSISDPVNTNIVSGEVDLAPGATVAVTGNVGVSGGPISLDGGTIDSIVNPVAVTQSGTWDEVGINDSGNSITVDDGGSSLTVDGTVTANLAAGTNNIGDVDIASIAAGDNNIGNVDVVTLPSLVAGTANIGDVDVLTVPSPLSTAGNGTAATAHRVTIASDSTGVVQANAGTNLNTSALALESGGNLAAQTTALQIMDDWDESDRAKVNVIAGQAGVAAGYGLVSAATQRVIVGYRNTYVYAIASAVHVAAANTVFWDMFNADASLIVRVMSIKHKPNVTTAVTGVVFDWLLERTTAVGTGGTAQTAWLSDLSQTALDADITCRLKPSGGATQSTDLVNWSMSSEETNAATIMVASLGGLELVPEYLRDSGQGIMLRQNQGLRVVQITNSNAGNSGFEIAFTVE